MKRGLLLLILLGYCSIALSQPAIKHYKNQVRKLSHQLNQKTIEKKNYLKKIGSLTNVLHYTYGPLPHTDSLEQLLQPFYNIAWAKDTSYKSYRSHYFKLLMNNSDMLGEGGRAVFYAQKFQENIDKNKSGFDFVPAYIFMEAAYYTDNKNFHKAIHLFNTRLPLWSRFLDSTRKVSIPNLTAFPTLQFLHVVSWSFVNIHQKDSAQMVINMADTLNSVYHQRKAKEKYVAVVMRVLTNIMKIELNVEIPDLTTAGRLLTQTDSVLSHNKDLLGNTYSTSLRVTLNSWWIKYYLARQDYKKALAYLKRNKPYMALFQSFSGVHSTMLAQAYALKGDYQSAYKHADSAVHKNIQSLTAISRQTNNLSLAQARLIINQHKLLAAEKAKTHRLIGLIILAVIVIIIIFVLLMAYYRRKRLQNDQITRDKRLKAFRAKADELQLIYEERLSMAQNLHDGLLASLAGLIHRIEILTKNVNQPNIIEHLNKIYRKSDAVYIRLRKKSHQLTEISQHELVRQFTQNIIRLLAIATPGLKNKQEIEIEPFALMTLTKERRRSLSKVIREGILFIMQDVKSAPETFVFLFTEEDNITLKIGHSGQSKRKSSKRVSNYMPPELESLISNVDGVGKINFSQGYFLRVTIPVHNK